MAVNVIFLSAERSSGDMGKCPIVLSEHRVRFVDLSRRQMVLAVTITWSRVSFTCAFFYKGLYTLYMQHLTCELLP